MLITFSEREAKLFKIGFILENKEDYNYKKYYKVGKY